jgi:hypothetical protein
MPTLLLNGCSFANIWKPSKNFLSELNCGSVVNLGKDGGSVTRAVRTTVEWVAQNGNPTFVIIPIPLASRWELSISNTDDTVDGTWYPMQVSQYIEKSKISTLVDLKKLENLAQLYYGSIPDIRTYWDRCFTEIILLSSFLEQRSINYLMFDMCNNFDMQHLQGYNGFDKINFIKKNKKVIDIFNFCGNKFMYDNNEQVNHKKINEFMHHHDNREYKKLEQYLLNYRKLPL